MAISCPPFNLLPRNSGGWIADQSGFSSGKFFLLPVMNRHGLGIDCKSSHKSSTSWSFSEGLRSNMEGNVRVIRSLLTVLRNLLPPKWVGGAKHIVTQSDQETTPAARRPCPRAIGLADPLSLSTCPALDVRMSSRPFLVLPDLERLVPSQTQRTTSY